MIKKVLLIFLIYLALLSELFSKEKIMIVSKINDQIITNHDVKKEISYLKILNLNLSELSNDKIFGIGKKSLTNELIKKKELLKFFDFKKKNSYLDQVFKNFYENLNIKNEKDFEEYLSNKKTYSSKEIKEKLKVEILWNDLIYKIYNNQVKIDESKLIKRINNEKNFINEYLLSEIYFKIEKGEKKNTKFKKIKSSIDNVGFSNTANLFSISKSSSYGGKIGWVKESNLSTKIKVELKKIDIDQYSKIIQIGNNFLILKIEDKRSKSKIINKEARLEELKKFETNRQLNLFSNIHFNKIKINYTSNEK